MTAPTVAAVPREEVSVLIAAAGTGQRMGLGPKAQLEIGGHPLEDWVARKAALLGDEVIIARVRGAPAPRPDAPPCLRIEGGPTRQESVRRLAQAASRPWVIVWDVSRPFATVALARSVLAAARAGPGAACSFLPLDAPVARSNDGSLTQIITAREAGAVQTPLAFARAVLLDAVERAAREQWLCDSTVELMDRAGHAVTCVPGERRNIKLTTQADWDMAAVLGPWLEAQAT